MMQLESLKLIAAAIIVVASIGLARAQHVLVFVNGEPITAVDVEQRLKLIHITGQQKNASRQEVVQSLIDEKLKVAEAKRWGLTVSDKEVESSYSTMASRSGSSPDQMTQALAKSGVNVSTLKGRIKAELAWQQLVRGRFNSRLQLSEKDLPSDPADSPGAVGYDYVMRPILFLVPPGAGASTYDSRRRDVEALRGRFRNCQEGLPIARAMRDVAVRDQVARSSADLPEGLRKIIDSIPVGQLTAPEITKHGIELFAICSKTLSKSDSPSKRHARDILFAKKFEQESDRYIKQLRRAALIEHR